MSCPKCGSCETEYIPENKDDEGERAHRAHAAHEMGNAYKDPARAVFAGVLLGAGWLMQALRHNRKCQACHHTWGSSDQEREHWWELWKKPGEELFPEEKRIVPMWERCTFDVQLIISAARWEAAAAETSLQPQHLLLALLEFYAQPPPSSAFSTSVRTQCVVWVVETLLLINGPGAARALQVEIERVSPPIRPKTSLHELPPLTLGREFQRVLACAGEEARAMGSSHIGVGHMLLGILGKGQAAAAILRGLQLPAVREKLAVHLVEKDKGSST